MVSVIYVNYYSEDLIINSINSLISKCPQVRDNEIIISNNAGDLSRVKSEFPFVIIIENNENVGFGKANNVAVETAIGDFILLLNPDTLILNNCLEHFVSFYKKKYLKLNIGVLGGQIFDKNLNHNFSSNYHASIINDITYLLSASKKNIGINSKKTDFEDNNYKNVDAIIGCNLFMSKRVFKKIGGFDDEFFMYFEDLDICRSIFTKFGLKSYVLEDVKIIHFEGGSSKTNNVVKVKKVKAATYSMYITSLFYYIKKHKASQLGYFLNRTYFKLIVFLNISLNGLSLRKVFDFNIRDRINLIKQLIKS
jgi:GT2 family glycosyltransferase